VAIITSMLSKRAGKNAKNRIGLYILILGLSWITAMIFARYLRAGFDFPVFYHAACIILDPNAANDTIYTFNGNENTAYPLPEVSNSVAYVYSMAAAYIMAPLAFLPYYWAKTTLIFLDLVAYMGAVVLILRNQSARGRYIFYPLMISLLWLPFLFDLFFAQINAILLLLVTSAVLFSSKNYRYIAGFLLGIASLFKLFPIAIALVLGIKNWRIAASCIGTIGISLLLPGSLEWFSALKRISTVGFSDIYKILAQIGPYWGWFYLIAIGTVTAFIAWYFRNNDYRHLASLAIPAAFLAAPVVEYYHLTLLTYAYLNLYASFIKNKMYAILMMLSATLIYYNVTGIHITYTQYGGIALVWLLAVLNLKNIKK